MDSNHTSTAKCRLGILLSGRGSNFQAIYQAIQSGQLGNAEIALVVSNHADAAGLQFAKDQKLPTLLQEKTGYENRAAYDRDLVQQLQAHQVELIVLAGFDRILSPALIEAFQDRILNIHPSLLPAYGGKNMVGVKVHQAVIENQESASGCSVHVVTETVDGGPVLGQSQVPVLADDTPETLAARILKEEHALYPRVIGDYIQQIGINREATGNRDGKPVLSR
jgi:phosphoribosylglycinamide formyltransferase-1